MASRLVPLSASQPPAVVTSGEDDVDGAAESQPQGPHQRLNQVAHRRWKASTAVEFLNKVYHVEIQETRVAEDQTVLYALEVHLMSPPPWLLSSQQDFRVASLNPPFFVVERSFSDFEELRQQAYTAVSAVPPCTCRYCLGLLLYLRFTIGQPRGIVKFTAGTEKRKKILAQFISDLVALGRRRVEKVGKRECDAQLLIPVLLKDFLVGAASTS
ncbi:unnamed protein product [Phytophthora lilii]|uniref:Unnamed protein product n=1 Tax=Phytophthora lilii TaxID=2077276 RepID=A0A9W6WUX9_9STRA|nr:unnamed protein product [Phytophthora lilii]